jgi:hypothetical protein
VALVEHLLMELVLVLDDLFDVRVQVDAERKECLDITNGDLPLERKEGLQL